VQDSKDIDGSHVVGPTTWISCGTHSISLVRDISDFQSLFQNHQQQYPIIALHVESPRKPHTANDSPLKNKFYIYLNIKQLQSDCEVLGKLRKKEEA
jgi:hypothetical protein